MNRNIRAHGYETMKKNLKIWKCECGNEDQARIMFASDGEVVCGKCGTVLGEFHKSEEKQDQTEEWDGKADLCRKILEDRVSKRGWEF
jgi:uncharacterized Zn finger protein (UPF0148 family)